MLFSDGICVISINVIILKWSQRGGGGLTHQIYDEILYIYLTTLNIRDALKK